jgi:hypothetical protein
VSFSAATDMLQAAAAQPLLLALLNQGTLVFDDD